MVFEMEDGCGPAIVLDYLDCSLIDEPLCSCIEEPVPNAYAGRRWNIPLRTRLPRLNAQGILPTCLPET
ncbi:hypothetical protein AcV7_010224 [Taiwanofungus camphoratus]|nr:hypothetical protein AcV7_010224 [Antrodia cinnamomea]